VRKNELGFFKKKIFGDVIVISKGFFHDKYPNEISVVGLLFSL
jgi:hypothetical protein